MYISLNKIALLPREFTNSCVRSCGAQRMKSGPEALPGHYSPVSESGGSSQIDALVLSTDEDESVELSLSRRYQQGGSHSAESATPFSLSSESNSPHGSHHHSQMPATSSSASNFILHHLLSDPPNSLSAPISYMNWLGVSWIMLADVMGEA